MLYNFKMVKYHNKNIDTKKILKEAFQITHITLCYPLRGVMSHWVKITTLEVSESEV